MLEQRRTSTCRGTTHPFSELPLVQGECVALDLLDQIARSLRVADSAVLHGTEDCMQSGSVQLLCRPLLLEPVFLSQAKAPHEDGIRLLPLTPATVRRPRYTTSMQEQVFPACSSLDASQCLLSIPPGTDQQAKVEAGAIATKPREDVSNCSSIISSHPRSTTFPSFRFASARVTDAAAQLAALEAKRDETVR